MKRIVCHEVAQRPGSDLDAFNITAAGSRRVCLAQLCLDPCLLAFHCPPSLLGKKYSDMDVYELIQSLACQGWKAVSRLPNKRTSAYTAGSEKTWFYSEHAVTRAINTNYLTCLLKSEEIFKKNVSGIHHFQPVKYYAALLTLDPDKLQKIRPFQPASFYTVLMQNKTIAGAPVLEPEEGRVGPVLGQSRESKSTQMLYCRLKLV